jgi:Zn-dependent protease with chaperone function
MPARAFIALALALATARAGAATAESLATVQARLQRAAAPWCERLSERGADGVRRCTVTLKVWPGDPVRALSFMGDVIVSQGLLDRSTEAELALVAGHELAHLVLGHPLTPAALASLPVEMRPLAERTSVPPHEDTPTDRLQLELDADRLGLFFAGLAGYPVQALAEGWPAFIGRLPIAPQTGATTHPASAVRTGELREAAREFCGRGERAEPLMPALARLQPRHEADIDALREQQARLPLAAVCRATTSAP